MGIIRYAALAATLALVACDATEPAEETLAVPEVDWNRHIAPLFERSCNGCHRAGGIAPFGLESHAEAAPYAQAIRAAVESKTMPPWMADDSCNTYLDDPTLTPEEIERVARWVELGAPEGPPLERTGQPAESAIRADVALEMAEPYTPTLSPDDYRCFVIPWEEAATKYVAGFRAVPGNASVVHHVIAYLVVPGLAAQAQARDEAEAGPGYTCFSGPGVGSGADAFRWLGAWAPGSAGTLFPEGTGLRIEPGSMVVLQVHYNTVAGTGADRSTVELQLVDEVEREAVVIPFTSPFWLDGAMPVPAGREEVRHRFAYSLSAYGGVAYPGLLDASKPVDVHTVALHMHQLGARGSLRVRRAGEAADACLLDVPAWDFHWQGSYSLASSLRMEPEDALEIECVFDNSAENQPFVDGAQQEPRDVNWGDGSFDEMCLGILYVTQAD